MKDAEERQVRLNMASLLRKVELEGCKAVITEQGRLLGRLCVSAGFDRTPEQIRIFGSDRRARAKSAMALVPVAQALNPGREVQGDRPVAPHGCGRLRSPSEIGRNRRSTIRHGTGEERHELTQEQRRDRR